MVWNEPNFNQNNYFDSNDYYEIIYALLRILHQERPYHSARLPKFGGNLL